MRRHRWCGIINMETCPLASDNRALIHALRVEKGWGAPRMNDESVQAATSSQNDGVYANVAVKRDVSVAHPLKGRKRFSQSMVSVAVSNLGKHHWCLFSMEPKSTVLVTVTSFWIRVYYQTFINCLVITSHFNRMMRQLIVHNKQLRFASSRSRICGTRKLATK